MTAAVVWSIVWIHHHERESPIQLERLQALTLVAIIPVCVDIGLH